MNSSCQALQQISGHSIELQLVELQAYNCFVAHPTLLAGCHSVLWAAVALPAQPCICSNTGAPVQLCQMRGLALIPPNPELFYSPHFCTDPHLPFLALV